jgi:hypothetical protein
LWTQILAYRKLLHISITRAPKYSDSGSFSITHWCSAPHLCVLVPNSFYYCVFKLAKAWVSLRPQHSFLHLLSSCHHRTASTPGPRLLSVTCHFFVLFLVTDFLIMHFISLLLHMPGNFYTSIITSFLVCWVFLYSVNYS